AAATDAWSCTGSRGYSVVGGRGPPPTVSSIYPVVGPPGGGTKVTVTVTAFVSGASLKLGGSAVTGGSVTSPTTITGTTAAHAAGAVDVVVTNPDTQA